MKNLCYFLILIIFILVENQDLSGPIKIHWRNITTEKKKILQPSVLGFDIRYYTYYVFYVSEYVVKPVVLTPFSSTCIKVELFIDPFYDPFMKETYTNHYSNFYVTYINKPELCFTKYKSIDIRSVGAGIYTVDLDIIITNTPPLQCPKPLFTVEKKYNESHLIDISRQLIDLDNDPLTVSFINFNPTGCGLIQVLNETGSALFTPNLKFYGFCNVTFLYTDTMNSTESFLSFFYPRYPTITVSSQWRSLQELDLSKKVPTENNIVINSTSKISPLNCVEISIQNPSTLKFKVNRVGICNFTTSIKDGSDNESVDFSLNFMNSRPIARNSNFTIQLNETIKGFTINFTPIVSDEDGDPLTITQFSLSSPNVANLTQTSPLSILLKRNDRNLQNVTVTFSYSVTDGLETSSGNIDISIYSPFIPTNPPIQVSGSNQDICSFFLLLFILIILK